MARTDIIGYKKRDYVPPEQVLAAADQLSRWYALFMIAATSLPNWPAKSIKDPTIKQNYVKTIPMTIAYAGLELMSESITNSTHLTTELNGINTGLINPFDRASANLRENVFNLSPEYQKTAILFFDQLVHRMNVIDDHRNSLSIDDRIRAGLLVLTWALIFETNATPIKQVGLDSKILRLKKATKIYETAGNLFSQASFFSNRNLNVIS